MLESMQLEPRLPELRPDEGDAEASVRGGALILTMAALPKRFPFTNVLTMMVAPTSAWAIFLHAQIAMIFTSQERPCL